MATKEQNWLMCPNCMHLFCSECMTITFNKANAYNYKCCKCLSENFKRHWIPKEDPKKY